MSVCRCSEYAGGARHGKPQIYWPKSPELHACYQLHGLRQKLELQTLLDNRAIFCLCPARTTLLTLQEQVAKASVQLS